MPHPGDLHHCRDCGSRGAAKNAATAGLCEHKEACEGIPGFPHDKRFKRIGEDCKSCEVVVKADAKRQQEQRKRDEKATKKRTDVAFFKQTKCRKNLNTRR
ncbi:hypothetical protein MBLNU13_g07064t1 [Cladosporium sp. NU13]